MSCVVARPSFIDPSLRPRRSVTVLRSRYPDMGQLFSSPRHAGHLDPGIATSTAPTGAAPYVLLEQPGIDIKQAQSNPSKEHAQSNDGSTTFRLEDWCLMFEIAA